MTYFAGLGLSLSLIIAIGAQNVFVLRQGLRREHLLMVVVVCAASDILLIALGVSGIGLAITGVPWLVSAARWAGAAFLVGYGLVAARRAWRPAGEGLVAEPSAPPIARDGAPVGEQAGPSAPPATQSGPVAVASATARDEAAGTARAVLVAVLAVTWLNPHVYLDTVFLMGAVASTHGDARWVFAAGAMTGSILWFAALGAGARLLAGPLGRPHAWRLVDAGVAGVMLVLAAMLALGA